MNQTIKQSGVLRLKAAVEALEDKLNKSKVINAESALSESATRIDTEILKALKTENKELKEKQDSAKEQVNALINELKAQV
ncbi:MAG TPA: hypothetical protein DCL21_06305 [Alphaproteobacteria bacterium]|nr:hypothetical protein [Alphaproteobacteria bacterium]